MGLTTRYVQIGEGDVLPAKSGGYLIEKFLGQGSFGKVARCVKLSTKERMAVKIVKNDSWFSEKEELMLKKLRNLDQDKNNLVKFLDRFKYGGLVCLAFELLDINLYDFMKQRHFMPLHLCQIRIITQQMHVALNALKSISLVHADIKPDNIMFINHQSQPFKLKLIDFGLAAPVSALCPGTEMQALGYRAPEVILGLPLNEAVDMWALGCVLAFVYLGQHLYPTDKDHNPCHPSWRLNTQAEYTTIDDTRAFLSLLKQMLHVDPDRRITPSEALEHRFIKMTHLTTCSKMQEESTTGVKNYKTSSKAVNWNLVSITSSEYSADEETACGSSSNEPPSNTTPAIADRTAASNYTPIVRAGLDGTTPAETEDKLPSMNEAIPSASGSLDCEDENNTGEKENTGFVEVKTRGRYMKRIRRFFSRLMNTLRCC
uniref:Protein kinase domain-containing protein n=1 Tax=Lates calcarifer TaxID=8187 RepID=A0A4W6EPH8_LATCA